MNEHMPDLTFLIYLQTVTRMTMAILLIFNDLLPVRVTLRGYKVVTCGRACDYQVEQVEKFFAK